jgi:hypothetical protein
MAQLPSRDDLARIQKLVLLPEEARQSPYGCDVTRLTILKSLCHEPAAAHRFLVHLARKTLERVDARKGRSERAPQRAAHRLMMTKALTAMNAWLRRPTSRRRQHLIDWRLRLRQEQSEYQRIKWGDVRIVHDWDLLLFEEALESLLSTPEGAAHWAYRVARDYAERGDAQHGSGLTPKSVPLLRDIADFWLNAFGLTEATLEQALGNGQGQERRTGSAPSRPALFTQRQGQYLAFIDGYRRLHRQGPAEQDLMRYFRITPPTVHTMLVKLQELGLVRREPGVPRSLCVTLPRGKIPELEEVSGPPW